MEHQKGQESNKDKMSIWPRVSFCYLPSAPQQDRPREVVPVSSLCRMRTLPDGRRTHREAPRLLSHIPPPPTESLSQYKRQLLLSHKAVFCWSTGHTTQPSDLSPHPGIIVALLTQPFSFFCLICAMWTYLFTHAQIFLLEFPRRGF